MNKLLDFIEHHKYGILVSLILHVAVFVYFQLATFKEIIYYEPWDFRALQQEAPDDIEISPEQIQTLEESNLLNFSEEITSFVKNKDEQREKSQEKNIRFTSSTQHGNPQQIEDEYERKMKAELMQSQNNHGSEDIQNDFSQREEAPTNNIVSSEKAIGGETMVSYQLFERHPLHHNDWHVRNPGYTCGNVNGMVKVAIIVAESGEVISATVLEAESHNATPCMKQKAKEYALLSRFNYDANALKKQDGSITYRFVYRE